MPAVRQSRPKRSSRNASTDRLVGQMIYAGALLAKLLITAAVAGIYAGKMVGFREGEALAEHADAIASIMAVVGISITQWIDANQPRAGSEGLARDVDELRADGVSRANMRVVTDEQWRLIESEVARLERIKPLRDQQATDERLEALDRG